MKKQKTLFGIRYILILLFALTLISGYALTQTTQFAYTANLVQGSVSMITTIDNRETHIPLGALGHGIALTDDDQQLVVAMRECGMTAPCTLLFDAKTLSQIADLQVNPAWYVAITPPINAGAGLCRYAYVTTTQSNVYAVSLCPPSYARTSISVPGIAYGVTVANLPNGITEVWVTDSNNAQVSVINPLTFAVQTIQLSCPATCQPPVCCPDSGPALPRHIAFGGFNPSNPNEYWMYVTDVRGDNSAVWVVQNIIHQGLPTERHGNVINPLRWRGAPCNPNGNAYTYGIAIKQDNSKAYVTWTGDSSKLFTFQPFSTSNPTCFTNADGTFNQPTGVAWLDLSDGRAYVANSFSPSPPPILGIINPNGFWDRNITLFGSPNSVVITSGRYSALAPGPWPSARVH